MLTYMDDRPVWNEDRRKAAAYMRGGIAAEREEIKKIQEEKSQRMKVYVQEVRNERERAAQRVKDKREQYRQMGILMEGDKEKLVEKRDNLAKEIESDELENMKLKEAEANENQGKNFLDG